MIGLIAGWVVFLILFSIMLYAYRGINRTMLPVFIAMWSAMMVYTVLEIVWLE